MDRSAAYASRYLAKNIVASKISDKCLIQLAYAIGVSKPLSIYVDLFDNDEEKNMHVEKLIKENFDLSPRGIREMLGLNKAIYEKTAAYGHFGRVPESDGSFSWEKLINLRFLASKYCWKPIKNNYIFQEHCWNFKMGLGPFFLAKE